MAKEEKFIPKYIRRIIQADKIKLTFTKSRRTYSFTPDTIVKMQVKSFEDVAAVDSDAVAKAVYARLLEKIEENQRKNNNAVLYKRFANIIVEPSGEPFLDIAKKYVDTAFNGFVETWKDAPLGEAEDYNEIAERAFSKSLDDTAYKQDMTKLDISDINNTVLLKNCLGTGPQYFYFSGEYANGNMIWHKALNPFIWYGVQE